MRYINARWRAGVTLAPVKTRRFVIIPALLVLLAAAAGWWRYGRGPSVTAVAASRGTAVEIVYATGGVEPVTWAKVASLVRGRIAYICHCEGEPVKQGAVLAQLDASEATAALKELKAREVFLKNEMSRVSALISKGAATTQSYERASMDLGQVQGLIAVQNEKIGEYTIVSPMDGLVLRRDGETGEIAEVGQVLFRVGVPKPLQVVAEVNEEDIPRVKVGQQVLFRTDAFPDRKLTGMVRELTPMGDIAAKTFRIKIALPEDTPLQPGMSVEANVVIREKANALLIPADAPQGDGVFVVDNNRVRKRPVTIGIRGTRQVEVLSGLKEGERIASPATPDLRDGLRVRTVHDGRS
ncbi:MAG TPA: efflux RND transporter periplasmic adaptor subunit [Pseudolabrys sp.]|nr:efflux RND transporter periplasmic adaptor subunit [Pseudolabrys sp.]